MNASFLRTRNSGGCIASAEMPAGRHRARSLLRFGLDTGRRQGARAPIRRYRTRSHALSHRVAASPGSGDSQLMTALPSPAPCSARRRRDGNLALLGGTRRSSSRRFPPDRPAEWRSKARCAAGPENARSHAQGRAPSMASTIEDPPFDGRKPADIPRPALLR